MVTKDADQFRAQFLIAMVKELFASTPDALANTQSVKRERSDNDKKDEFIRELLQQKFEPKETDRKCVCGAASVGSPGHSQWCSLNGDKT